MTQVAIYVQDDGIPAVVFPTPEALSLLTMQQIATRSIPAGKAFRILDVGDLPEEPQEAWEVDVSQLTDGFGELRND